MKAEGVYMKKCTVIVGLVLALTLSGCKLFNKKEKDNLPKKENYETAVTYEEFNEKSGNIMNYDAGEGEEYNPSFTSTGKFAVEGLESVVEANGKEFSKATSTIDMRQEGKYDSQNDISSVRTHGTSKGVMEKGSGKQEQNVSADFTRVYQALEIEGNKETIAVNEKGKEYYDLGAFDSNKPSSQSMMMLGVPVLLYAFSMMGYSFGDETEKAKYAFYIDNDELCTSTYKTTDTRDLTQVVEGETVKYATITEETEFLFQIKPIKNGEEFKGLTCYMEYNQSKVRTFVTEYEDTSDKATYYPGQVVTEKSDITVACRMEIADVSLTAVNVTALKLMPVDPDSEFNPFSSLN